MDEASDLSAQERALKLGWAFCDGERLDVQDIANLTGLHRRSAYRLVNMAARVLPITLDATGRWVRMDKLSPESAPVLTKRVRKHLRK